MRKTSGFTIVELLIVIAILAVLSAIAISGYIEYLPKYRASGAARKLFTELQYAKMKAIADENDYVVTFDTSTNSYSIYDDNNNDGPQSGELVKTLVITIPSLATVFFKMVEAQHEF